MARIASRGWLIYWRGSHTSQCPQASLHITYQHCSIIHGCGCLTVSLQHHASEEIVRHSVRGGTWSGFSHSNTSSSCAQCALQTAAADGDTHHQICSGSLIWNALYFTGLLSQRERARDVMLLLCYTAAVSVTIDLVSVSYWSPLTHTNTHTVGYIWATITSNNARIRVVQSISSHLTGTEADKKAEAQGYPPYKYGLGGPQTKGYICLVWRKPCFFFPRHDSIELHQ